MATKKITELPLIQTISGSFSVVPIVIGNGAGNGTTDQITIENFSKFVTQYSAHTGSAGNTYTGPQTINNNVTINGRLTVHEIVANYETSSILFSTGSTKLGDQLTDKHEFTGSNWKKDAMRVVSYYFALKDVKIQTLHPFSTSYNITTGQKKEPANLWLDNIYIKVEDLLT